MAHKYKKQDDTSLYSSIQENIESKHLFSNKLLFFQLMLPSQQNTTKDSGLTPQSIGGGTRSPVAASGML